MKTHLDVNYASNIFDLSSMCNWVMCSNLLRKLAPNAKREAEYRFYYFYLSLLFILLYLLPTIAIYGEWKAIVNCETNLSPCGVCAQILMCWLMTWKTGNYREQRVFRCSLCSLIKSIRRTGSWPSSRTGRLYQTWRMWRSTFKDTYVVLQTRLLSVHFIVRLLVSCLLLTVIKISKV
jgi:hypothetical protein